MDNKHKVHSAHMKRMIIRHLLTAISHSHNGNKAATLTELKSVSGIVYEDDFDTNKKVFIRDFVDLHDACCYLAQNYVDVNVDNEVFFIKIQYVLSHFAR